MKGFEKISLLYSVATSSNLSVYNDSYNVLLNLPTLSLSKNSRGRTWCIPINGSRNDVG